MQQVYKIRDKNKRLTLFKFNNIQCSIWRNLERNGFIDNNGNILKPIRDFTLKYRQGGVSTFWLLFWLDDTIFTPNTVTGIQAHKKESLGYLFEIIRLAYVNLPSVVKPFTNEDSKSALSFHGINSKIFISLSIRSTALHNLHISEWAFCKDPEIMASLGAISPKSNVTGETTGNGVGNHAYELYQEAKRGESEYKANFYPWFIQDEYRVPLNGIDSEKFKDTIKTGEKKFIKLAKDRYSIAIDSEQLLFRRLKQKDLKGMFRQELPEDDDDAFLTSGNKFFEPRKIHKLLLSAKEYEINNRVNYDKDGDWIQWEEPQKGHIYVCGADTSEGVKDYSVLKILCCTCKREAFVYRAMPGVDVFYRVCNEWGRKYNNALMAIERNNHGHAVILGLDENMLYPNLYKENKDVPIIGNIKKISKTGWSTNRQTKYTMLDDLKYCVEGESDQDEDHFEPTISIYDQNFLREALTFEQIRGKLQAIEGKHDDSVIASAIAYQMYKKSFRLVKSSKGGIPPGLFFGIKSEFK